MDYPVAALVASLGLVCAKAPGLTEVAGCREFGLFTDTCFQGGGEHRLCLPAPPIWRVFQHFPQMAEFWGWLFYMLVALFNYSISSVPQHSQGYHGLVGQGLTKVASWLW